MSKLAGSAVLLYQRIEGKATLYICFVEAHNNSGHIEDISSNSQSRRRHLREIC
ncbi:MAG: hypothetical protein WCF23_08745 [Candidatus Nitrosopolaris sp.]